MLTLLKSFIAPWFESILKKNFSTVFETIKFDVKDGHYTFESLTFKEGLFDASNSPFSISFGHIGAIDIAIPWAELGTAPVVVEIREVFVLIKPKYEWDPVAQGKKERKSKSVEMQKIENQAKKQHVDNQWLAKHFQSIEAQAAPWIALFCKLLVETVQIRIHNVHFRFEDDSSFDSSFCAGLSLESIEAIARKSDSFELDPGLSTTPTEILTKFSIMVKMNRCSIYWNPLLNASMNPLEAKLIGKHTDDVRLLMSNGIKQRKDNNYIFSLTEAVTLDASFYWNGYCNDKAGLTVVSMNSCCTCSTLKNVSMELIVPFSRVVYLIFSMAFGIDCRPMQKCTYLPLQGNWKTVSCGKLFYCPQT